MTAHQRRILEELERPDFDPNGRTILDREEAEAITAALAVVELAAKVRDAQRKYYDPKQRTASSLDQSKRLERQLDRLLAEPETAATLGGDPDRDPIRPWRLHTDR